MRCRKCGADNQDDSKFCNDCGTPLQVPTAQNQRATGTSSVFAIPPTQPIDASTEDALTEQATRLVQEYDRTSVSFLQRKLGIGYPRAARLMDKLEERSVVGPEESPGGSRAVLISRTRPAEIGKSWKDLRGQTCFVCQKGRLQGNILLFTGIGATLKCGYCHTEYHNSKGKYVLIGVPSSYEKWKFYQGQLLSREEIQRISNGGWSDTQVAEQIKQLPLSEKALQLATEKPYGWAVRLFAQVIIDQVEKFRVLSQQSQTTHASNLEMVALSKLDSWVADRLNEFKNISNQLSVLVNSNRDIEKSDDVRVIVALSLKVYSFYVEAINWSQAVSNTPVDSVFADIPVILASYATAITEGIERLGPETLRQVENAVNAKQAGEPKTNRTVTLDITVPTDTNERLAQALERLKAATRPNLSAFIGQESVIEKTRFQIQLARKQVTALRHILLCGPDGEGKSYLAECIANEMQVSFKSVEARSIERAGDLTAILTNQRAGDVLLLKHIENLNQPCAGVLAPAMTDFTMDVIIGKGPSTRQIRLKMPHFTLVGTAPNQGAVRELLRNGFDVVLDFAPYDQKSLAALILMATREDKPALDTSGATEIAKRANGSLRAGRKLAQRVRDYAVVNNHNIVDEEVVLKAFGVFRVENERSEKDKTGVAFELKCMGLLRRRNFEVKSTKRTSDGGVDLVAWSNDPFMGGKYVVQCKDWSNPVGAPIVRDLYGVVHSEDANRGILITASSFTQEALEFAAGKRLELIDGKQLNYLLAQ